MVRLEGRRASELLPESLVSVKMCNKLTAFMKHFKNRNTHWIWAIGLLARFVAHGTGFDLPDQDPFAIGRGMAFVATADNPSAIYYNPAGLTQLSGSNLRVGVYGLYLDPSYKS